MPRSITLTLKMLPSLVLGVVAIFLTRCDLSAQKSESRLKTSYIYRFGLFTEWEQEEDIDTFRIGIYGQDPELLNDIMILESLYLKEKHVSVKHFNRIREISNTQLLYITREKTPELQRIVNRIAGNNTLMVSDQARNQDLIMINFLQQVDGMDDFEVNIDNIINADLEIALDLFLLGVNVHVDSLYRESRKKLKESSDSLESQNLEIEKQRKEIEKQKGEIDRRNQEIETQDKIYEEQMLQIKQQQEAMDAYATQLANLSKEEEKKQETLDSKSDLIKTREEEIRIQRKEILIQNNIKSEQEDDIAMRNKKIEEQDSQIGNMAKVLARQKTFLYIIITVCFLIAGLVFFIYRGYRIKKNANQEIEGKSRDLQFTLENLKLAQSQLVQSEKMASMGLLTAGIAHELNNPINFVKGNVKPLRRDVDDLFSIIRKYDDIIAAKEMEEEFSDVETLKDKAEYSFLIKEIVSLLEGIEEGATRSGQIIKGLRSFSRLDEEKCQFYDIHEGIDASLILLNNKIKDKIRVHKDYGDFELVECYPGKLNQVFMNILTNSIQAIEEKGEIFIQTIGSDIGIKIIIKDNGIGMTPEVKKHIFEPFYTTKDVGKGTGLGLSISFGIIERHNGNIDVISEPGKGTEFIISLPKIQTK